MWRELHYEDIISSVVKNRYLSQHLLLEIYETLSNYSESSNIFDLIEKVKVPTDFDKKFFSTYRFFEPIKELSLPKVEKPWSEGEKEIIVFVSIRIVLTPLIEKGIFCVPFMGYHNIHVAYNASSFTKEFIKNYTFDYTDISKLCLLLENQCVHNIPSEDLIVQGVKKIVKTT